MTAEFAALPRRSIGNLFRFVPLRPSEGWLSLVATAFMVVVVGWSFVDAGWTLGGGAISGFLPYVGVVGVGFGVLGAKVGWGRWRTHFVGALFAGLGLPLIVGGIALHDTAGWDPQGLAERMAAAVPVARHIWTDLVVEGRPITTETLYYHVVLGAVVWGAGLLAGFTVFGHRRPLDAVVVLGLVLLADMALTTHDQLILAIAFSAAALMLLIRTHVFDEEITWLRRRIGDPTEISQLYLGGGATFVSAAILGAVLLTFTAASAPLQDAFADLPQQLQSIVRWLQKFQPPAGNIQGPGIVTLGDHAVTSGLWAPSDRIAFRAQLPRTEADGFKWRAGTFSVYTGFEWNWGTTRGEATPARGTVLGGDTKGDKPDPTGRREIDIRITPEAFVDDVILSPNTLESVDRPTNAIVIGTGGWFTSVEANEDLTTYSITALVPDPTNPASKLTETRLRLAGTTYPDDLFAIYTALPRGAMGPNAAALLDRIRATVVVPPYAEPGNPFDLAKAIQNYLRDAANFTYQADVRTETDTLCRDASSTVECFAIMKRGYCDHYASTMTVLLRASGIPARIAYGFLPVEPGTDGLEVVPASQAHYWVEVYFPDQGWVEFDPTGGGVGRPQVIPTGSPDPLATPRPSRTPGPTGLGNAVPTLRPGGGGDITPGAGIGPFIAIALILGVGLVAVLYAVVRRTPRRPMHPDEAWGSLAKLAARIGLGPRPSQTVYEYAGALGDAVPRARVELTTIARAKVEVAYGQRDLGGDRLRRIAEAYQRLRFALLGVLIRRGFRRRGRGGRKR